MTFYDLVTNKMLLIPLCAWFVAQLAKLITLLVRERRLDWRLMVSTGGMPSSHAAVVAALATAVGMVDGLGSVTFGVAVIVAFIVMNDAAGVRQSVGQQAAMLNRLIDELRFRRVAELERDLKEFVGHTGFQVAIGAIAGIIIAWVWITLSRL
jgi:acid phosphatase family membrane protein YuiD